MRKELKISKGSKGILLGLTILAVSLILLTDESFSGTSGPGVRGTRHDLSPTGSTQFQFARPGVVEEICVFCHTPHLGNKGIMPLWNRSLSPTTFTMYSSVTFNMGPVAAIGATSALCMSCHDGIMAMNMVVNSPGRGSTGSIPLFGSYSKIGEVYYQGSPWGIWDNIGGGNDTTSAANLSDEHPVSFTYNNAADLQGNNFPAASGGTIQGAVTTARYRLYGTGNDQFECSTCHDVHDTATYATKDVSEVFFLRTSNEQSRMCRDCHRNKF